MYDVYVYNVHVYDVYVYDVYVYVVNVYDVYVHVNADICISTYLSIYII